MAGPPRARAKDAPPPRELVTVAATGGVAHPPGDPLRTMLAGPGSDSVGR